MDHIKNSPNLPAFNPVSVMTLREPNDINTFSPWEIDFRQIDPGAMDTTVKARSGCVVTLLNISMSRTVHQTGVSPKGLLTFGLIQPNSINTWQGQDTSSTELLSFGSSDPFDGVSAAQFSGTTVSVEECDVELMADALGLDVPNTMRNSDRPAITGQHRRLTDIRQNVERLLDDRERPMTAEIEEEIIGGLLLAANCGDDCEDKSSQRTRSRAVSKAIDLMLAQLDQSTPISRICRETGVSWRTLDRAFSERFGVGPKRYYLRVRLNRVRSDLIRPGRCESISDMANKWGFWHLGQFAHDYRHMFGELPSDTAARYKGGAG
ncbi:helix-turn-helix domain-containing protein [Ruegeria litorea]|uniref:Helix-turn-helix domain-containing protein n=1 Tax=Falsiruegeria litorea TaxID=1280831 RepID=A0ABS5WUX2_9RHOB|nr:helix-turn-helix domain-containing protein [Falsiruegeria litorea]MBT3142303.1 helix-turn-helix domain-containing protein [Falsiruegeria litorea]